MHFVAALMSVLFFVPSHYSVEEGMCYENMSIDYSIHYDRPTEGYEMGEKVIFNSSTIPFKKDNGDYFVLETEAAKSFLDLVEAATKAKFKIVVNSAFRTRKEQTQLRRKLGDLAARVGWSNHQSGTAVDIAGMMAFVPEHRINPKHFSRRCQSDFKGDVFGYECPTRLFWWMKKNAPKFGFYNTVEDEPWHWDYLGFKPSETLVKK